MNIAFFTESFPRTSETFILDQIVQSIRAGHHVTVFPVVGPKDDSEIIRAIPDASIRAHLTVRTLRLKPRILVSRRTAKALNVLPKLIRAHGRTNITQVLQHLVAFAPQRFEVIHAHFGPSARRAAILRRLGWVSGPLISTFHGFDVNVIPRKLPLSYYSIIFSDSAAITCGSRFIREKLVWMGAPRENVHLLPMPIDAQRFSFRQRSIHTSTVQLLSVGRLIDCKGHVFALKALRAVDATMPNWHYTIIGDGPERNALESAVTKWELNDNVTLLGAKPHTAVAQAMHDADILLHPSVQGRLGSVESQGVVLAEGAASGLPIIAFDSGGISDTVLHEQTGLLVDEADIDGFANAILHLARNSDLWPVYGENGRNHIVENFNTEMLTERRHVLYRHVVNT